MFDVPEDVVNSGDPTLVRTVNEVDKCARIVLHTAFTAPAGSTLNVYGCSLDTTERVVTRATHLCPFGNVGDAENPLKLVIVRDDKTTVELRARPGTAKAVRGDNPSHVFVVGHIEGDMVERFMQPLFKLAGRVWVFVGNDNDMETARLICDPRAVDW
jgi:hypothetical protein